MNIELFGIILLKEIIFMILFIVLSSPNVSENDVLLDSLTFEKPAHTMKSTYENRFGEFTIQIEAKTVTTGVFGYPSTKVLYSVYRDGDFLHPNSLDGGCVIGGDMITPTEVILVSLGKEGTEVGWVIGLDGISGNTFSYMMTLVVPTFDSLNWKYHSVTFLAKEELLLVPEEDGLEVWSQYQEWGGGGTAVSFFVPQLRRIRIDERGAAQVFLDRLPPDYKKWPPLEYSSFLGLYLAGVSNLNPELMESSLDLFEPDDAPICRIHGLPEDKKGLKRLIDGVRQSRTLLSRFRNFELEWDDNFQGEALVRGLEDLYDKTSDQNVAEDLHFLFKHGSRGVEVNEKKAKAWGKNR